MLPFEKLFLISVKPSKDLTESELIENLKGDTKEHNNALGVLFEDASMKTPVISFLKSKGLRKTDAETLWTDIVVKFGLLVKNGKYEDQSKLLGYLLNLANFIFLNHIRSKRSEKKKDQLQSINSSYEVCFDHKELKGLIKRVLSKLGQPCMDIVLMWSQGYSMKEIREAKKIVSDEACRKRKHNCMKKLLSYINDNESLKQEFNLYRYD